MKNYSKGAIYLSAHAKLPTDMPSGGMYKAVDIGFIINPDTGEIEDVSITLLTDEARNFLKQIIAGYDLNQGSVEPLLEIIKKQYMGASQKAICVAIKLIYEKYTIWQSEACKK